MKHFLYFFPIIVCVFTSCNSQHEEHEHTHTNYVTQLKNVKKKDVGNGELVYQMEGKDFGFNSLSFTITETHPGGGPPMPARRLTL